MFLLRKLLCLSSSLLLHWTRSVSSTAALCVFICSRCEAVLRVAVSLCGGLIVNEAVLWVTAVSWPGLKIAVWGRRETAGGNLANPVFPWNPLKMFSAAWSASLMETGWGSWGVQHGEEALGRPQCSLQCLRELISRRGANFLHHLIVIGCNGMCYPLIQLRNIFFLLSQWRKLECLLESVLLFGFKVTSGSAEKGWKKSWFVWLKHGSCACHGKDLVLRGDVVGCICCSHCMVRLFSAPERKLSLYWLMKGSSCLVLESMCSVLTATAVSPQIHKLKSQGRGG